MVTRFENPIWQTLQGPGRSFARTGSGAAAFETEVAPFSAVRDDPSPDDWDELASLVAPSPIAVIFAPPGPPSWNVLERMPCYQMVATRPLDVPEASFTELGSGDVPEMLDLVNRTQPGPFAPRTIELGTYLGVRTDGKLVAMAGERMRGSDFVEVSAICTDEAYRRKGWALALTQELVHRIQRDGKTAILHVLKTNTPAIKAYEKLGFEVATDVDALILQLPS
jgi:predicted GNAT family acetyltransferase